MSRTREQTDQIKAQHDMRAVIPSTSERKHYDGYDLEICPFHDDAKPSFLIFGRYYKCCSCGTEGDIFDWCREKKGWEFGYTLEHHGELPEKAVDDPTKKPVVEKQFPVRPAIEYYLANDEHTVRYFKSKGLSLATIVRFKLGYGPHPYDAQQNWDDIPFADKRFTIPLFEDGKLYGIKFRRNDCCPSCWNPATSIEKAKKRVHFGDLERVVTILKYTCPSCAHTWVVRDNYEVRANPSDGKPQIVETTNRVVKFRGMKDQKLFLWGLKAIPENYHGDLFVVEGEWDRMVMWQHGYHCVTSTGGAQAFPTRFATSIAERGFRSIIVAPDMDEAGLDCALAVLSKFPSARVLSWRNGCKDVSEAIAHGYTIEEHLKLQDKLGWPLPSELSQALTPSTKPMKRRTTRSSATSGPANSPTSTSDGSARAADASTPSPI